MRAGTRAWWGGGWVESHRIPDRSSPAAPQGGRWLPRRAADSHVSRRQGRCWSPPPHLRPQTRPCGQRIQGELRPRSTRRRAQKAGCPGRLLLLPRDRGPGTGFRCASRRESAGDPHPRGAIGHAQCSSSGAALSRFSPQLRAAAGGGARPAGLGGPVLRDC